MIRIPRAMHPTQSRILIAVLSLPILVYLLHPDTTPGTLVRQATGYSDTASSRYTHSAGSERPAFHPHIEDGEEGYGLHLVDEELDHSYTGGDSSWGLWGWSSSKTESKRPSLLVTGGAGQLGQALLPRLTETYSVHILDISPRPSQLPPHVVYHRGSVLPPSTSLKTLLSTIHFEGVLHLAAVSLDFWCAPKEADCLAINEGGVKAVVKQIEGSSRRNGGDMPWVIMGSSMDVFGGGEGAVDEQTSRRPESALGRTKLKGEETFEKLVTALPKGSSISRKRVIGSGLRGMILRFSDIYGYPVQTTIAESFFNSLIGNAITSLPIQFDTDSPALDLLHHEDAVEAVLLAMDQVKSAHPGSIEAVNVVAGRKWEVEEIVDRVRESTGSMSPVRALGNHKVQLDGGEFHNAHALSVLSWSPKITLPEGLHRSLTDMTQSLHDYSLSYLHSNCPETEEFPRQATAQSPHAAPMHAADERNKPLHKLDGCHVNVAFEHDSFLHHLKCDDGKHCEANGQYVAGYNWNSSVWIVHAKRLGERRARVRLEEEKGTGWLGAPKGIKGHGEVQWELVKENDPHWETEFDIEVAPDSSFLRLSLPGTSHQIHSFANVSSESTWFSLDDPDHLGGKHFDMRMNVLCCSTEDNWPLLLDDYESSDMRFGSTGQIPFNSSRRLHTCSRTTEAARYTSRQLQSLQLSSESSVVAARQIGHMTDKPHDWAIRELPPCWNDCDSPMVCVQTGSCRCVQAECPTRRENPILALRHSEKPKSSLPSHLGVHAGYSPVLINDVKALSFEDVLLPSARQYLAKHPDFIKVHVADGYEGQEAVEAASCHKLANKHCFSADNIMYKAMRSIQSSAEEAELIVLPVYQHCTDADFMLHDVMHHANENIPGVKEGEKRVSIVMTHDWGICIAFAWEIWSARNKHTLYPDWILDNTIVMSVMGDYDSPCYRPHQDIVVPARSCQSNNLRDTFSSLDQVKPMRERPNLMTWAGTYWGTGKSDRLRLTCERGGAGQRELVKGGGAQSKFESWDYMNDLSNARFCPQPRGIAGWSPRTNDAIYAGCIPVIIAEGSHYPFATFLDWTKFSVRVESTELDHIEQILESIPLERVEEMQANLALVREGFLYSTDEAPEEETKRRGPMWFAMHEMGMRLRTKYPTGNAV